MTPESAVACDIALIGGGHAHVEVLRRFAMAPQPGVRLTLIARDILTPYSGMLPGYLAGLYGRRETHVDLRPLAARAGARLLHAAATGLDPARRLVRCRGRPPVRFDLASLDIGSTTAVAGMTGADLALPVKPVEGFLARWRELEARAAGGGDRFRVVVVGGGAAGSELCLGLRNRLRRRIAEGGGDPDRLAFALVTDSEELLPRHGAGTRRRMTAALVRAGIAVHTGRRVTGIEADGVACLGGPRLAADAVVLATGAAAPAWLARTGLDLDEEGFVRVDRRLRSLSHPHVLAVGDAAAFSERPLAKNGVHAVRQGPRLADTLRRLAAGEDARAFRPQRRTLALLSTGRRHAVASWGPLSVAGGWVWRWKDAIDRRWMARYGALPAMPETPGATKTSMRCGGCGAKVAAPVLRRALARLEPVPAGDDIVIGLEAPDDAAIAAPPPGQLAVQTVDQFPAFLDDPFVFGRIAAVHAMADLHAMGAEPAAALALAGLPVGDEARAEDDLVQMLSGALTAFAEDRCSLVGGHTSESERLSLGFAVTGWAPETRLRRKGGLRPGDRLVLTKPLGTGALFAADMRGLARGDAIEAALAAMSRLNGTAARILIDHGATAMTDVSGFGLAGHLMEMLAASRVAARLDPSAIPAHPQARELLARGVVSTLHSGNVAALDGALDARTADPLLFDPQTAGGLLGGIAADDAPSCVAALHEAGIRDAALVGEVETGFGIALA